MFKYKIMVCSFICSLLIAFNAKSLTVKVQTDNERKEQQEATDDSHNIWLRYYLFIIGESQFSSLNNISEFKEGETFEIENSKMEKTRLSVESSQRLLRLLHSGWQSSIRYKLISGVPSAASSSNPPCSFIMFHIAFGNSDFTSSKLEFHNVEQFEASIVLSEIIDELQIGDVVTLSSTTDRFNKNTLLYLGNDIFLTWDSYSAFFRFQSSEQITSSFRGKYSLLIFRKILPVISNEIGRARANSDGNSSISIEAQYSKTVLDVQPIQPYSYVK